MTVRSKRTGAPSRWRKRGRDGHGSDRANPSAEAIDADRATAYAEAIAAPARERRHGGPTQDHALYTCGCGYVFEAAVSTSVLCPHCGHAQAW